MPCSVAIEEFRMEARDEKVWDMTRRLQRRIRSRWVVFLRGESQSDRAVGFRRHAVTLTNEE